MVCLTRVRVWTSLRTGRAAQSKNLLHLQGEVLERRTVCMIHPAALLSSSQARTVLEPKLTETLDPPGSESAAGRWPRLPLEPAERPASSLTR